MAGGWGYIHIKLSHWVNVLRNEWYENGIMSGVMSSFYASFWYKYSFLLEVRKSVEKNQYKDSFENVLKLLSILFDLVI